MRIARLAPLVLALALPGGGHASPSGSDSLIQLTRAAACTAAPELRRAGGVLVAPEWLLERRGYRTPIEAREHLLALAPAPLT